jgi:hypothetical protein
MCLPLPARVVAAMFSSVACGSFAILSPVSVSEADDKPRTPRPAFS